MVKPKIGIVFPQHYLNPDFLGLEHLKLFSSLPLEKIDTVIIDIKDVFGNVFVKTTGFFEARVNNSYISYFNELMKLINEYKIKVLLGVPCLHDNKIVNRNWLLVNAENKPIEGRLCPNQPGYLVALSNFIDEVSATYPEAGFFLPFLRFPPSSKQGFTCFCANCMNAYQKKTGVSLTIDRISSSPDHYYEWLLFRCELIAKFIENLHQATERVNYFAIEVDLDPSRYFRDGLLVNDGHNYSLLSEQADEFVIHFYDKTDLPDATGPGQETAFDIALSNMAIIRSFGKPVSLFFWNIDSYKSLKAKLNVSFSLKPEKVFFLLFSSQASYFIDAERNGLL